MIVPYKLLKEGVFPSAFKTAHLIPLLKKPSLAIFFGFERNSR